jgi:hypothetical protein
MELRRYLALAYGRWARNWQIASYPVTPSGVMARLAGTTDGVQEAYLSTEVAEKSERLRRILTIIVDRRRSRIVTRDLQRGLREAFVRDQRPEIRVLEPSDPQLAHVRRSSERLHPHPSRRGVPWWVLLLGG